jgi:hypothetical protein
VRRLGQGSAETTQTNGDSADFANKEEKVGAVGGLNPDAFRVVRR